MLSTLAPAAGAPPHAGRWLGRVALVLVLCVLTGLPTFGDPGPQDGSLPDEDGSEETEDLSPKELEEPFVEMTDAERILGISSVIEFDREKLAELRNGLEEREADFRLLAEEVRDFDSELEEARTGLAELDPDEDTEEIAALEATIEQLEEEQALHRTQLDLALTAESTTRDLIRGLEKKIEREERALDALRGLSVSEPSAEIPPAAAAAVETPQVAPESTRVREPMAAPTETAAQVAASRALARAEAEVESAELAVVEFVKRNESLQQLIELERTLLETARESRENLERAIEFRRQELDEKVAVEAPESERKDLEQSIARVKEALAGVRQEIDERSAYLATLGERLQKLQEEELVVSMEVDAKRRLAEKAHSRLIWLQSPLHPESLARWLRQRGPRVLLVVVATGLLLLVVRLTAHRLARVLLVRGRGTRSGRENRADTLAVSSQSMAVAVILIGGLLLMSQEAGVDVRTVLGGAAIFGVAVAFGAQNLMRDFFTGFMILIEDQYGLGDLVTIGAITGTVEAVNMRTTVLRDLEGRVHFIPNGGIKVVTNRTYEWGRAVLEIPVAYEEDVDHVMAVLTDIGKDLRSVPEFGEFVTGDPVMLGVDKFTEAGVVVKFMVQTRPDKLFPVRREMMRRIKKRFDELGIRIAVPAQVIYRGKPGD